MIRLTSQQKEAINEAASVSGLSMSAWVLERCLRAAKIEVVYFDREVK